MIKKDLMSDNAANHQGVVASISIYTPSVCWFVCGILQKLPERFRLGGILQLIQCEGQRSKHVFRPGDVQLMSFCVWQHMSRSPTGQTFPVCVLSSKGHKKRSNWCHVNNPRSHHVASVISVWQEVGLSLKGPVLLLRSTFLHHSAASVEVCSLWGLSHQKITQHFFFSFASETCRWCFFLQQIELSLSLSCRTLNNSSTFTAASLEHLSSISH